jgi:protocatechuate 3,4-dioxygenase beta subunit
VATAAAVVLAAVVSPLAGQVPAAPPQATGSGLIAGQVVDADTGRGIGGAMVAAAAAPQPGAGRGGAVRPTVVAADSQGRFYFAALPAGQYMAESMVPGYTPVTSTMRVELADGERKMDLRLALRRLSSVSGTVRDETGAPVVGIDVVVLRRQSTQGRPPVLQGFSRVKTDDRGEYRLPGLQPGDYYICACSRDVVPFDGLLLTTLAARPLDLLALAGRAMVAGADAATFETPLRSIPPTFHPGTTVVGQAEPLRLSGSESLTGVDIAVATTPGVRVSGRIIGAPGSLHASFLRLYPEGDVPEAAGLTLYPAMLVQPDGRFDFGNIPPGVYRLDVTFRPGTRGGGPSGQALQFVGSRASALSPPPAPTRTTGPPSPANDPLWASQVISVGDQDVAGLVVGLNRGLTVSGRIEFSGTAQPPQAAQQQRMAAVLMSLESGVRQRVFQGSLQPDGSFSIGGVIPADYVLIPGGFTAAPWTSIKSMTIGGVDVTDTLLTLDRDVANVVITLTDEAEGVVDGRVVMAPDDSAGEIYVRVFPTDKKYWQSPFAAARRYRSSRIGEDGTFSVPRIPAGEYFVATAVGGGSSWMDMETLESMARTAERVRMPSGGTVTVEVRR